MWAYYNRGPCRVNVDPSMRWARWLDHEYHSFLVHLPFSSINMNNDVDTCSTHSHQSTAQRQADLWTQTC